MKHEIHYIKSFKIVGLHTVEVVFENNICKTINLAPVLYRKMYGPLEDPDFFKHVKRDDEVQTLVWPTSTNFAYEGHFTNEATWNVPQRFKAAGYSIHLIFFGLKDPELSQLRVIDRAKKGGHYVSPVEVEANFYGISKN